MYINRPYIKGNKSTSHHPSISWMKNYIKNPKGFSFALDKEAPIYRAIENLDLNKSSPKNISKTITKLSSDMVSQNLGQTPNASIKSALFPKS